MDNKNILSEKDIKFEALQQLRGIQAGLVGVSFLPVLSIMKPDNEYRKTITDFQDELDELTLRVQQFITKVRDEVKFDGGGDASGGDPGNGDNAGEDKENDNNDNKENNTKNESLKIYDSSISIV